MSRCFTSGPETLQLIENIANESDLEKIQEVLPKISQLSDDDISQCIAYYQYHYNSLYSELDPAALELLNLSNITKEEFKALNHKHHNILLMRDKLYAFIEEQQARQNLESSAAIADEPDQIVTSPQAEPITRSRSQQKHGSPS